MTGPSSTPIRLGPIGTLWLTPEPMAVEGDDVAIVLDPAWTPDHATSAAGRQVAIRDTMDEVLRVFDPIVATSELLDDWAARSGVIEALVIGRTSFWYYVRLRHWIWLQERVLWAQVMRRLLDGLRPRAIRWLPGADPALIEVARLMAAADGLEIRGQADGDEDAVLAGSDMSGAEGPAAVEPGAAGAASRAVRSRGRTLARWPVRLLRAAHVVPGRRGPAARRRDLLALVEQRLARLAAEPERRLLIVLAHDLQRVETPDGPRFINPYLGPVADRLADTPLEPILVDWRAKVDDPTSHQRITGPGTDRVLPLDAIRTGDLPVDPDTIARADAVAARLASIREPAQTCGIDLGPSLARDVSILARSWFPAKHRTVDRLGRLLERLHVCGILLAVEYYRQDWLEAATARGIPVAAVQHGTINRHHRGYIHDARPAALHLADRTYVFGSWERDRLVRDSVYRDDEVVVAGSPRLEMDRPDAVDRGAVRAELGVAPGDRLVVLSGTWGSIYRRFHYPVVLARLFDRPLPRVHLVVKQHPAETDEGPYRAVVEGVAAARGFSPPPITVVRDVDLYRLLRAADAHLGVHSTVLTEAVFTGTPNLLASGVLGGDLLDYVAAGVAIPVADGADLLAALDAVDAEASADTGPTADARARFLAAHFEPGAAAQRIADDLLAWLPMPNDGGARAPNRANVAPDARHASSPEGH